MTLKDTILQEAANIALKFSLGGVTRLRVSKACGCAVGTINYHFDSMDALREAVITYAIKNEVIPLLALYAGVPKIARRLSPELRQRVAQHIAGK